MKKFIASIMALTLCVVAFAGCTSKTDSSIADNSTAASNSVADSSDDNSTDASSAEVTYGVSITTNKDLSIPMQYDTAFINDGQAKVINDYFYAMQTKDEALYRSAILPEYAQQLESLMDEGRTLGSSLESLYNEVSEQINGDFEFSLCDITEGKKVDPADTINNLMQDLNTLYSTNHDSTTLSDAISSSDTLMLNANITISKKSSDGSIAETSDDSDTSSLENSDTLNMDNNVIYVVDIDGKYYVIPYVG